MMRRFLHLLIALDQLAWVVLTLGAGFPDETISAAAHRMERDGKLAGRALRPLIDALMTILTLGRDTTHCANAYESERVRRQLPRGYE